MSSASASPPPAVRRKPFLRLGLAPEGARIPLALLAVGVIALLVGLGWLAGVAFLAAAASAWFFRDPERHPPGVDGIVTSGADGKVVEISEGPAPYPMQGRYKKVGVFMSPLNVHVNRSPVDGEVLSVTHTPGEFRAAFSDYASERNERNLIVLADKGGRLHAMVQIAGYLARRIVCRLRAHDVIGQGERLGVIMFGSRVDHFIPPEYRVTVALGQHVKAGESVIGELTQ